MGRETETGHGWKKMAKKKPMKHRMTEAEWIVSNDSHAMLQPCRSVIMDHRRKGYLFAAACCYRIWHLLADDRRQLSFPFVLPHLKMLPCDAMTKKAFQAARNSEEEPVGGIPRPGAE